MLGWIVIGASMAIMAKIALVEERSPFLWGALTFVICLVCAYFIPLFMLNIIIGLVISYLIMFVTKLVTGY